MKEKITYILLAVMLAGCGTASSQASSETASAELAVPKYLHTESPESDMVMEEGDYSAYAQAFDDRKTADSYTAGVSRRYEMNYDTDTGSPMNYYDMDGVLEVMNEQSDDPKAHAVLHVDSDGLQSEIEGWYENGRLYNTYNNVTYYEDMSLDDLKNSMLVPMNPLKVEENQIADIQTSEDNEKTVYVLHLKQDAAESLFENHYDIYGLKDYDDYAVRDGTIQQTFQDGWLSEEKASFTVHVSSSGIGVDINETSTLGFVSQDDTEVNITSDQEQAFAAYVNYKDIDTSSISSADLEADAAASTATETFRKRIVSRLGYTLQDDGTYRTDFNTRESYTIDFSLHQFTYTNYTSSYVYNWKGDTGGFSSTCSYDFKTDSYTDGCDESVVEQMKNVKNYFIMELYYCGLSLDQLQAESE